MITCQRSPLQHLDGKNVRIQEEIVYFSSELLWAESDVAEWSLRCWFRFYLQFHWTNPCFVLNQIHVLASHNRCWTSSCESRLNNNRKRTISWECFADETIFFACCQASGQSLSCLTECSLLLLLNCVSLFVWLQEVVLLMQGVLGKKHFFFPSRYTMPAIKDPLQSSL